MAQLVLEASDLSVAFGQQNIFHIDSFSLYKGDRVGLIGENGAGKTTLLRVLSGELKPDTGTVRLLGRAAYIRQGSDAGTDTTDAYLKSMFRLQEEREGLSGGERTRRRIAAALAEGAQILFADEPTNDLDSAGIALLREQLLRCEGALVLVSHDRALLDSVCTSICELRDGSLETFPGNYAAYREERERRMSFQRDEYEAYRAEEARLREAARKKREMAAQVRKTPSRMGNSEARLHKRESTDARLRLSHAGKVLDTRLEHLEKKERVREDPDIRMTPGSATPVVSATALELRQMNLRVGGRFLLQNASMRVPTGSVTCLLGENGCGKTSLIRRILAGNDPRIRLSPGVEPGLFGQDQAEELDLDRTAVENALSRSRAPQSDGRTVLARLGIAGDEALKKASLLSGGERAKVALARLMLSDCNFLILDEPTNHLDVYTMEALEPLLREYAGTVLLASHDERFVSAVATRLVFFENGTLNAFEGTWEEYQSSLRRDVRKDDLQTRRSVLEMRMAAISVRMAAPKKGDDPLKLNEEYFDLARQLRELK